MSLKLKLNPLTKTQRKALESLTRRAVGRIAARARVVLLSTEGKTVSEIVAIFGWSHNTVRRWMKRYQVHGIAGLYDKPRSGRPPRLKTDKGKNRSIRHNQDKRRTVSSADESEVSIVNRLMKKSRLRQQEDAGCESEEGYRDLIEKAPHLIFTLTPSGTFASLNAAFETLTGWHRDEWLGKPFMSLIHPADAQDAIARFHQVLQGDIVSPTEVRGLRQSNDFVFLEVTAIPLHKNEQVIGVWGIARDITAQKQAEEELQALNRHLQATLMELDVTRQQAIQRERLHALGTMASGIVHDLNNALSPIVGFSEFLLNCSDDLLEGKEEVTRALQMINVAATDATHIVRRVREFYRQREPGEIFQPVDLNSLIEHAVLLTQPRWKAQSQAKGITITLEADLAFGLPHIAGNEAELRAMLTNLIFNAVDALPDGGAITVRTHSNGEHVFLEVSDTGIGMSEEVRHRCFEPFFSTKGEAGTGLGLSMVFGIIGRHEGKIEVESEVGVGTTFRIRLPVLERQPAADNRQEATQAAEPVRSRHILIVDDEQQVCEVAMRLLTTDGHTVEIATSASKALEQLQKGWFDLVVTDQRMPGMSGNRLASIIKRIAPNKPIILLMEVADLMNESVEKPESVDVIVSKPFTRNSLREAIAKTTAAL